MDKMDEILEILKQIQDDMGGISAKKLKPMDVPEAGLKAAMESDEAKEAPGDDANEPEKYQELEEALGVEKHDDADSDMEEEEVLPRWKQRQKKGF
jgi:hypothetical protein